MQATHAYKVRLRSRHQRVRDLEEGKKGGDSLGEIRPKISFRKCN